MISLFQLIFSNDLLCQKIRLQFYHQPDTYVLRDMICSFSNEKDNERFSTRMLLPYHVRCVFYRQNFFFYTYTWIYCLRIFFFWMCMCAVYFPPLFLFRRLFMFYRRDIVYLFVACSSFDQTLSLLWGVVYVSKLARIEVIVRLPNVFDRLINCIKNVHNCANREINRGLSLMYIVDNE